jgi:outer membrane protein assembly factor BamD
MKKAMPNISGRLRPLLLTGFLALAGCHHSGPSRQAEPATLYRAAMEDFRRGRFEDAQKDLQRLQFDLPARDSLQASVRFYLAETYAGMGEIITAARDFRRVADDYPSDQLAPTALLRVGDQYARLWRRAELDPANGETALAAYQELIGRYPDTQAAQLAQVRVHTLEEQFARKDFENALFYFKRNAYDSAILYFTSMIAKYPASSLVPDAFIKLVQSYRAIGYREELEEKCSHLRQYFGTRADVRRECPATTTSTGGNGNPGR